jgi:cytidylate kinase
MAEVAISAAEVGESLKRRDTIDSGRKTAPLRVASDAAVIDSSRLGIDEVVAAIVAEYERRCGR